MAMSNRLPRDVNVRWDGAVHLFSGPKGGGCYLAFPDRSGVAFSCHQTGVMKYWVRWGKEDTTLGQGADPETPREAIGRVQAIWAQATPADTHPYLSSRKLENIPLDRHGLRVSRKADFSDFSLRAGELVVPLYRDGELVNVQLISSDGSKRFVPEAPVWGCGVLVGGCDDPDLAYVCVGWVTALTIHEATGWPAAAALFAGGLKPWAKVIRERWPEAEIVVAADNDRWSWAVRGYDERVENPGVHFAREAAKAAQGQVAIPDFEDLTGKPTTFADLWQLENVERVEARLDPEMAEAAIIREEHETAEDWVADAPFRILGYRDDRYFYLPEMGGELVRLTPPAHTRDNLLRLNPDARWWAGHFRPSERARRSSGARGEWTRSAREALVSAGDRVGFFDQESQLRGRGVWRADDGGVVLHLGDRMLYPERRKLPKASRHGPPQLHREGGQVFRRLSPLPEPDIDWPMKLPEARKLLRAFQEDISWEHPAAGTLLAGFVAVSWFGGASPGLSHAWIGGVHGSGKEAIVSFIERLCEKTCHYFEEESVAKIQRKVKHDALPVLYDMVGAAPGKWGEQKLKNVLRHVRRRATGASTASTFLIVSDDTHFGPLWREAERSGVVILKLRAEQTFGEGPGTSDQRTRTGRSLSAFKAETGLRLFGRTVLWFSDGRFDRLLKRNRAVLQGQGLLDDVGGSDLYGPLLTGAWMLRSDQVPDEEELREWCEAIDIRGFVAGLQPEGRRVLSVLLGMPVTLTTASGPVRVTVGELLPIATGDATHPVIRKDVATKHLRSRGFLVRFKDLLISNQSEAIKARLRTTSFATRWSTTLRTIEGAQSHPPVRFGAKNPHRCQAIPLHIVWRLLAVQTGGAKGERTA